MMHALRLTVAGLLVLGLAVGAGAQDKGKKVKVSKDKLVGTWQVVKSKGLPPNATVEFTRDGKLILQGKAKDKEGKERTFKLEAAYKVEGSAFKMMMKAPDGSERSETITVTRLTDTELHTRGEKGNITTFKKVTKKPKD
jgi:uncharacterized protein (TIGR03066 family)